MAHRSHRSKSLVFFYYSEKHAKQRFTFNHTTKVTAQTVSRGCRRLIQTYLYNFADMISRVPIQCNVAEISLNRIP